MNQNEQMVKGFLCLPITESAEKKIGDVSKLEANLIKGGVVFMKAQMTALEVIETLDALSEIVNELYDVLLSEIGICHDDCDHIDPEEALSIKLPEFLLEEAGIAKKAKLCAHTTEGSGEVIVIEADYCHDLSDVPPEMLSALKDMGACMATLNDHIVNETIIYGK